jgi:hypothetical protein
MAGGFMVSISAYQHQLVYAITSRTTDEIFIDGLGSHGALLTSPWRIIEERE